MSAARNSGGTSSNDIHRAVLAAARRAAAAPRAVLDFGAGTGGFVPQLRAAFPGAEITAADIMERPDALPGDVAWRQGDLNDRLPIEAASFDLIVAMEVIEHLENPRQVVREIARLLRPGGAAVLSTPNTGSLRSMITMAARGHYALFDDANYPAHITPITELDFRRIGAEAGLLVADFFYTDRGTIPKMLHRSWQSLPLVGPRLRGRRYSDNFGVTYRKP